MQEVDPAFLLPPISSTSEDDEVDLRVHMDLRVQKLNRLGVQRISADALIELASKLSEGMIDAIDWLSIQKKKLAAGYLILVPIYFCRPYLLFSTILH